MSRKYSKASKDMNTTEDTLKKIKEEKIQPKPAWHFVLKRSFIWAIFAVALLVGSLAVSVILFTTTNQGFALRSQIDTGFWGYVLKSLPYVWVVCLVAFLAVAILSYRHTKGGYKHRSFFIWLGSIVLSVVLGALFFYAGLGAYIEYRADRLLPAYQTIEEHRRDLFESQENLLAGEIIDIRSNAVVMMNDFDGKTWEVSIEQLPPFELKIGMRIGLIGKRTGDSTFVAAMVRPWEGPGRHGPLGRRIPMDERNMPEMRSSE